MPLSLYPSEWPLEETSQRCERKRRREKEGEREGGSHVKCVLSQALDTRDFSSTISITMNYTLIFPRVEGETGSSEG